MAHGPGHNSNGRKPVQWQTPHLDHHHHDHEPQAASEADLDMVEQAFVEAFEAASDPTSFLRVARIPFIGERNGEKLELLRVETELRVDIAAVSPLLGGGHKVSPLPKTLVDKRKQLRFIYLADGAQQLLSLAETRDLLDLTPPH